MSEMSQASAPAGGDPLDLTPDTPGVEGDALPGAGVDTAEESGDTGDGVSGGAMDLQGGGAGGDLESGADPMPDMSGTS